MIVTAITIMTTVVTEVVVRLSSVLSSHGPYALPIIFKQIFSFTEKLTKGFSFLLMATDFG